MTTLDEQLTALPDPVKAAVLDLVRTVGGMSQTEKVVLGDIIGLMDRRPAGLPDDARVLAAGSPLLAAQAALPAISGFVAAMREEASHG